MLLKHIATLGGIGHLPFAPGTFGTLAGLIFIFLFKPSVILHLGFAVFFIIIGIIASDYTENLLGQKDPKCVVIDEFAGYIVSVLFLPMEWFYLISAFFLFRFFDIIKPTPIKKLEHSFKKGLGIMADDMGSAVYTNILLQIWKMLN